MDDLFVFLLLLSDILILLFFFIFVNSKVTKRSLYAIPVYCLVNLLVVGIAELHLIQGIKFLFSLFTFVEYLLFAVFLYAEIKASSFKRTIIIASAFFALFLLFYYSTVNERSIDSIPIGVETILILIFCFYYLYEQLNGMQSMFIHKKYAFWVVFGIMIYLAGSVFIYVFANQVDRETLNSFWFLTNVFYIIKNILFAVGLFTYLKQSKINKNQNPHSAELRPYLN